MSVETDFHLNDQPNEKDKSQCKIPQSFISDRDNFDHHRQTGTKARNLHILHIAIYGIHRNTSFKP